jgi:CRP/FNR family transcriptional regulator, cyclic AMP receptor protein
MPRSLQSVSTLDSTLRTIQVQSLFSAFSPALRSELRSNATRRVFQDGAMIQHRGDLGDGFYIVERGHVKLGHLNADGDMQVLLLLGPNDSFGELACLGEFRRVVDAQALGETEVSWISDRVFQTAIGNDAQHAQQLIRLLAGQLQESLDQLIVFRKMPAAKRLAQTLLAMAEGRAAPVRRVADDDHDHAGHARRQGLFDPLLSRSRNFGSGCDAPLDAWLKPSASKPHP